MNNKVEAYQGSEKYAFISYAHKDSKTVYPIIKQLTEMGYRIWYDEGIPLVSDYGGVLYNRIKKCAAFIIFKSNNSVASKDVELEIMHASHFNKKIVQIVIDDKAEYPDSVAYKLPPSLQYMSIDTPRDEFFKKLTEQLTECYDEKRVKAIRQSPEQAKSITSLPAPKNVKQFLQQRWDVPEYNKMSKIINACAVTIYLLTGVLVFSFTNYGLYASENYYTLTKILVTFVLYPFIFPTIWLHITYSKLSAIVCLILSVLSCGYYLVISILSIIQNGFDMDIVEYVVIFTIILVVIVSVIAVKTTFKANAEFEKFKENAGKAE